LLEALISIDPHQHRPLSAGDAELAGSLIRVGFQQASYIHDSKGEFALGWLRRHGQPLGYIPYNKQAYNKFNMLFR
jgi:hypothetical protein